MWLDGTRDTAVPAFPVRISLPSPHSFSSHPAPARDSHLLPSAGERQEPECHGIDHLSLRGPEGSSFLSLYLKRSSCSGSQDKLMRLSSFSSGGRYVLPHPTWRRPDLTRPEPLPLLSSLPGSLGHRQTMAGSVEHLRIALRHS